jgi:hypothetical protein
LAAVGQTRPEAALTAVGQTCPEADIDIDIDIDIDSLFLKIRTRHCHEKNCLIKKFSHTMRA